MNPRKWIGLCALAGLAVSLNVLVWRRDFFSPWVLIPLAAGLLLGVVWLASLFAVAALRGAYSGRAVGAVNAVTASALFFGICVMLFIFAKSWDVSWDLTHEGRRALAPQTVKVLESMTKDVDVVCFFIDVDDELVGIAKDKTLRFLEQCQQYTSRLKIETLDPHVEKMRLEALKVTHASTQGTVVVKCGERQRVITLTGGSPRLEERDFTNALINVLRDTEPKVCFLTGHNERAIADSDENTGASMLKNLLEGESYKVEETTISLTYPEVPSDCNVLFVNNPRTDLHPQELKAIQAFLERGGRLMVLLDPWRQASEEGKANENLRPWLEEHYGIKVGSDVVVVNAKNRVDVELSKDEKSFADLDKGFMEYHGSYRADHPVTKNIEQTMLLQVCRTVSAATKPPEGVTVTELLRTRPNSWAESDVEKFASANEAVHNDGEPEGPLSVAAAAVAPTEAVDESTGKRLDARLVVVGDSEFAANGRLGAVPAHLDFMLNAIAWLTEREELIAIRPSGKTNPPLILSPEQTSGVAWVSTLCTVQLVLAAGLTVFILRRRHQ